ncbi:unnamed protein product [Amoebophrya sp. A120]|nr:unnamed protein product [Amoebophrya sp. A120]|eukprot:GSA120T00007323001.1
MVAECVSLDARISLGTLALVILIIGRSRPVDTGAASLFILLTTPQRYCTMRSPSPAAVDVMAAPASLRRLFLVLLPVASLALNLPTKTSKPPKETDTRSNCWRYLDQTDAICHSLEKDAKAKCQQHFCGPIFEATASSCSDIEKWQQKWDRLQASVQVLCPEPPPRHAGGDVEKSQDPKYLEDHMLDEPLKPCAK